MSKEILRKEHQIPFTQISNKLINDKRLRLQEIGLFVWMYSKPDGFKFTTRGMASSMASGRDAISRGLKILQECGWITYQKHADGSGEWILRLEPFTKPNPEKLDQALKNKEPNPEYPDQDNPDVLITKSSNNKGDLKVSSGQPEWKIELFEEWWEVYNKKVRKKKAAVLWNKKINTEELAVEIIEHSKKYVAADNRTNAKRYRLNPTTYLNQDAWEDEIIEFSEWKSSRNQTGSQRSNSAKEYMEQFKQPAQ